MPTTGTLSLFINDEKVGEGQIMTQPGNFSLVGEGLNVGKDPAEPVTDDYPGTSPYAFAGGTIKRGDRRRLRRAVHRPREGGHRADGARVAIIAELNELDEVG